MFLCIVEPIGFVPRIDPESNHCHMSESGIHVLKTWSHVLKQCLYVPPRIEQCHHAPSCVETNPRTLHVSPCALVQLHMSSRIEPTFDH